MLWAQMPLELHRVCCSLALGENNKAQVHRAGRIGDGTEFSCFMIFCLRLDVTDCWSCILHILQLKRHLFILQAEGQRETERERMRERNLFSESHPECPSQRQQPGTRSKCPVWVAGLMQGAGAGRGTGTPTQSLQNGMWAFQAALDSCSTYPPTHTHPHVSYPEEAVRFHCNQTIEIHITINKKQSTTKALAPALRRTRHFCSFLSKNEPYQS